MRPMSGVVFSYQNQIRPEYVWFAEGKLLIFACIEKIIIITKNWTYHLSTRGYRIKNGLLARLESTYWLREGVHSIWGICLGTFMIRRPTLGCNHWWDFVNTECPHDVIMTLHHSNGPVSCDISRRRTNFKAFGKIPKFCIIYNFLQILR